MRSIILFFSKNYFVFIFLFLEFISFWLVIHNNTYQKAGFMNSSSFIAAKVYQINHTIFGYFGLRKINMDLATENAALRSQSIFGFAKYDNGQFVFQDTVYNQNFVFTSASVINNSISKRNNFLTLNKGYNQGIKPEMGVFSSNGVVGIVKNVSDNFCTVLSVLHKNSHISARIESTGYFGSLIWNGEDFKYATLVDIPSHVKIQKGIRIVTSGYSAIFPEGLPVGTAEEYKIFPGDAFYKLEIKLYQDMSNVQQVYIVQNLLKEETKELEINSKKVE